MELNADLSKIRNGLFYGSANYTKSQPDLFIPREFQFLPPSEIESFFETVKESIPEEEVLLYVHLPFCFSECLFCNSFPLKADKQIQHHYLQSLLKEIDVFSKSGLLDGKKAKCIYFGGGTPTAFSNRDIKQIIDKIKSSIEFAENCNITSEAHPLTLGRSERIEELAAIGLNRISIGCQTFDPNVLNLCNRSNSSAQIRQIVKTAQGCGLAINIDMMTGLPGQTLDSVKRDLDILEGIRPDAIEYIRHEIVNPLVVELFKNRPDLFVEDDILFEMVYSTQEWMDTRGYEQNGRFTDDRQWGYRYYWLKEMPIISFGLRTRSYSKTLCHDKHEDIPTYARLIEKGLPPIARFVLLSEKKRMYRSLILGLQLKSGLEVKQFRSAYGKDPGTAFGSLLLKLEEYGCLVQDTDSVRLTRYGAYFVEDVCDCVIDAALKDDSGNLVRTPHSGGSLFSAAQQSS